MKNKILDKFMNALLNCDTVKVILTGCGEEEYSTKEIYESIRMLEHNGWIKCSDRLPEENSIYYLVSTSGKYKVDRAWYLDGDWFYVNSQNKRNDVIAWQPLPEPCGIE